MDNRKFAASLAAKKTEAPAIKTFHFGIEEGYEFKAGQFAFFEFDFQGKHYSKHFTISSSPLRKGVQFTTTVRDSDYKQALDKLAIGADAMISMPLGSFTLESRKTDSIAFLAAGIGITPVRSMLQFIADSGQNRQLRIVIFYSNRNKERIAFRKELQELNKKIPLLKIVHTLTDLSAEEKNQWKGETGTISAEMIKKYMEKTQEFTFFIVGPPAFNAAMQKILQEQLKIRNERIVLENFTGY
ncbi:MAG: FAD-dependent oxidoreductase [Candidatus Diapherotrites archaeon]|nr:FAD-dependent oxidoreductase [Candidatus Diapherotrites archaeon]